MTSQLICEKHYNRYVRNAINTKFLWNTKRRFCASFDFGFWAIIRVRPQPAIFFKSSIQKYSLSCHTILQVSIPLVYILNIHCCSIRFHPWNILPVLEPKTYKCLQKSITLFIYVHILSLYVKGIFFGFRPPNFSRTSTLGFAGFVCKANFQNISYCSF